VRPVYAAQQKAFITESDDSPQLLNFYTVELSDICFVRDDVVLRVNCYAPSDYTLFSILFFSVKSMSLVTGDFHIRFLFEPSFREKHDMRLLRVM
jgi:hypothetical protein